MKTHHNNPLQPIPTHLLQPPSTQQLPKHKTNESTIAELNKVSIKQSKPFYDPDTPFRIRLPEYFNIPAFVDLRVREGGDGVREKGMGIGIGKVSIVNKEDAVFRRRMRDLGVLAEGMKRAKNIKEESRYYFTQGVLLHNVHQYLKSIQYFQKFLKIVLYLQDLKSAELAFNAIGCSYMYLGDYKKSIQFHEKQAEVSQRSDKFISNVNIGLCEEMLENYGEAYLRYQEAREVGKERGREGGTEGEEEIGEEVVGRMMERVEMKVRENEVFMTENYRSHSPQKTVQNSLLKEQSSLILQKPQTKKQYQQNKLKYAIHAAEQNINEHIKTVLNPQKSQQKK